ncbi:restriction endonuclease [Rhodoferax sp.]|uniref:restriction endonuclease n=1 Tax=Rhodoferax sp. TaxID=50421 RepID=UPI002602B87A|nr:restriction endonuclease [Rhodoferax sp.]MDD2924431.1 restriction endonuclease [Rhodoferax sp.]
MMAAVASGLRMPGWMALAAGVLLLGIHHITKAKGEKLAHQGPRASEPKEQEALRDIREPNHMVRREPYLPAPQIHEAATSWSPAVFAAIEWRRFEAVCEKLFAQAGFETRSQSHGADGGVDIWLHSRNAEGPVAIVQCKHWQGKPVGVKEMREFFGVMSAHQLRRGTYATTSTYTADARQFAKDNGINALDGHGLLALIAKRTPEQQRALLDVAYEGEYWRPTCASCGTKMLERTPAKGRAQFWGCGNYPNCKSRLPMAMAAQ